jgi:hypothetical protein
MSLTDLSKAINVLKMISGAAAAANRSSVDE